MKNSKQIIFATLCDNFQAFDMLAKCYHIVWLFTTFYNVNCYFF